MHAPLFLTWATSARCLGSNFERLGFIAFLFAEGTQEHLEWMCVGGCSCVSIDNNHKRKGWGGRYFASVEGIMHHENAEEFQSFMHSRKWEWTRLHILDCQNGRCLI